MSDSFNAHNNPLWQMCYPQFVMRKQRHRSVNGRAGIWTQAVGVQALTLDHYAWVLSVSSWLHGWVVAAVSKMERVVKSLLQRVGRKTWGSDVDKLNLNSTTLWKSNSSDSHLHLPLLLQVFAQMFPSQQAFPWALCLKQHPVLSPYSLGSQFLLALLFFSSTTFITFSYIPYSYFT